MALQDRIATLREQLEHPAPKKWYKKWWGILFLLCLFLLISFIVASALYVYRTARDINLNRSSLETAQMLQESKLLSEGQNNYFMGTTTPKVTIVEFADFACPYCKDNFPVVRELGLKYKDDVKIIYRDYLGHDNSLDLALAARCAGEQGKFWAMHDKLFTNQGKIALTDLPLLAQQIGLKVNDFNTCLSSKKYLMHVREDINAAEGFDITKTPTWIINGNQSSYKIEGAIGRDDFIKIIDSLLP